MLFFHCSSPHSFCFSSYSYNRVFKLSDEKGIMPSSSSSSKERTAGAENSMPENSLDSPPSTGLPRTDSHRPDGKESDSEDEFVSVKIEFTPHHSSSSSCGGSLGESVVFDKAINLKDEAQTHSTGDNKELVKHYQDPLWTDKNISHGSSRPSSSEKSLIDFLQDASWSQEVPANRRRVPSQPSAANAKLKSNLPIQKSRPKNVTSESRNKRTEYGNCNPQDEREEKCTGCCSLGLSPMFHRSKQKAK